MRIEAHDGEATRLLRAMTLANFEGRVDDALAWVEALADELPFEICPWIHVTAMIDTLIMAGRYREALALPDHWSAASRARGAARQPEAYVLARVNACEALYNLGRVDEAAALVADLHFECDRERSPAVRAGVRVQQAWIAALAGRARDALELTHDARALPVTYRAELAYTRALSWSLLGEHARARSEALRGFRRSVRVSSFRNGHYLLGVLAHRAGEHVRALPHFEVGAMHPYRGQGGSALLCYGDTLRALGREREARAAYALVIARDPQGAACRDASARISHLADASAAA
ncbi:MAG TPA: hypothetical protein VHM19_02450 [Polyangiales bacterium]|jgi:tetratricopeptide (TPR) repeat protein|nr:hypothetical protein [Polyangiales bacterium]